LKRADSLDSWPKSTNQVSRATAGSSHFGFDKFLDLGLLGLI